VKVSPTLQTPQDPILRLPWFRFTRAPSLATNPRPSSRSWRVRRPNPPPSPRRGKGEGSLTSQATGDAGSLTAFLDMNSTIVRVVRLLLPLQMQVRVQRPSLRRSSEMSVHGVL
jgi:hypothetical protein